ncbi:hypothetical protein GBF38_023026, partial [Nibea albiflora]
STNGATSPIFYSLQSGDVKDHRLLLHLAESFFAPLQCRVVPRHLALWHCGHNLFRLCAFCPPGHAQEALLMPLQPLTPPQWGRDSLCFLSPSNPRRTTLVHWR